MTKFIVGDVLLIIEEETIHFFGLEEVFVDVVIAVDDVLCVSVVLCVTEGVDNMCDGTGSAQSELALVLCVGVVVGVIDGEGVGSM